MGQDSEGGSAGYYFQIAPGDSFLGAGCWMPPRPALQRFRRAIATDRRDLERSVTNPPLGRRSGGPDDDSMLKRMPRGFAEDHPAARWLKYQSFTLGRALSDSEATSLRLPAVLERDFVRLLPLVRWLNETLGLRSATKPRALDRIWSD